MWRWFLFIAAPENHRITEESKNNDNKQAFYNYFILTTVSENKGIYTQQKTEGKNKGIKTQQITR